MLNNVEIQEGGQIQNTYKEIIISFSVKANRLVRCYNRKVSFKQPKIPVTKHTVLMNENNKKSEGFLSEENNCN